MDTRTPRTPTGDRSSGYDDTTALNMVKVPSDPAQITADHTVFRVQFRTARQATSPRFARYATTAPRARQAHPPAAGGPGTHGADAVGGVAGAAVRAGTAGAAGPVRVADGRGAPVVAAGGAGGAGAADAGGAGDASGVVARRRAPVVWSGRSAPGDPGATGLLQAVRSTGREPVPPPTADGGAPRPDRGDSRPDRGTVPYQHADGPGAAPHQRADGTYDAGVTQVLPPLVNGADPTVTLPVVGAPRGPVDTGTRPLPRPPGTHGAGRAHGADEAQHADEGDEACHGHAAGGTPGTRDHQALRDLQDLDLDGDQDFQATRATTRTARTALDSRDFQDSPDTDVSHDATGGRFRRRAAGSVRHAYYPDRRMNLGGVLLPLRVFLGLLSAYAGMSKLCDPAYFDGGAHGSLVRSLRALHPFALAEPLRDAALQHPVGAGLTFAFLQVIVGLLTVLGLWQRLAAAVGALLAAVLVLTVSRQHAPGYDAPDIIYLAAWSPLVIAGAPVFSVDSRLCSEAWRTLGPRAALWQLRRRVLRRGTLIAGLATGVTLLLGALLGGAVRDADRAHVPGPGDPPRNALPGSPLPDRPSAGESRSGDPTTAGTPGRDGSADPSGSATAGTGRGTATAGARQPGQTQGTGTGGTRSRQAPQRQAPATSAGPSSSGGSGTATGGPGGSTTGGSGGGSGNLVGGLLG